MTNQKLSNDIQLIIESCKTDKSQDKIQDKISQIKNWQEFINLSTSHGVLPLVYHTLKNYQENIPKDIFQQIKLINLDIVKQNMLMTSELIKVMKLLEENDIEAIAFKGPTLAQIAYGDITLRQYNDLDILVEIKDIKKISKILGENNYKIKISTSFLDNKLYLDKNSDLSFYNIKNNLLIEVHWKLFRNQFSQKVDLDKVLYNSKEMFINNKKINIFSDEVLLVYLCMHGSKHRWERIEWIVDIDKLIRNSSKIDWPYIFELSKLFECDIMLNLGLYLTSKYFKTNIPDNLNLSIENTILYKKLDNRVNIEINNITEEKTEFQKNFESFKFHYYLNDTVLLKIKFIFKTLFPITGSDIRQINLPTKLYFLYYLIKPFRLLNKYVLKVFTYFRRK